MSTNEQLHTLLNSLNMSLDEQRHCNSNNTSATLELTENYISPLTHLGLLAIDGPDSAKFLQGQTTCNITKVSDSLSASGAYCSPKGRVVSSFHLARTSPEHYLLRMHHSIVESTKTVFSKYIVFSKAKQQIVSDDYLIIGLYGAKARSNIEQCFGETLSTKNQSLQTQQGIIIQLDERGLIFECWLQQDSIPSLWPQLSQDLTILGSQHWQWLTIQQGIADLSTNSVDLFIPQMLNYQTTGAISFTKGCYTGQEVVARMQYKGKLKRRLYRISFTYPHDQSLPAVATELYAESEQSIGNLVNVVSIRAGLAEALAVITNEAVDNNQVFVGLERYRVQILSLPYAIT